MDVILPIEIKDLVSNIPEPDSVGDRKEGSLWSASTAYKTNDLCFKNHVVYKSLKDSNSNNDPEKLPTGTEVAWMPVKPTNQWAMFDTKVHTQTVLDNNRKNLTVTVNFDRCTGFAVFNMFGYNLKVTVKAEGEATPYFEKSYDLLKDRRSKWRYRYEESSFIKNIYETSIGISPKAKITFEFTNPSPAASSKEIQDLAVGMLIVGRTHVLGHTEWGISTGSRNYTKITENDFGETEISTGLNAKKIRGTIFINPPDSDYIYEVLRKVEKVKAAWICDNSTFGFRPYECLSTYGYLNSFEVGLENYGQTRIPIEILGLI